MKRKSVSAVAASALALLMGLTVLSACGETKGTFDAPENVAISGAVVSWSAVEGADNGYVVKINDDELTVTVTSLDLTSEAAVGYLDEGENSVAVRVGETQSMNASAWSETVTYTYAPVDPDREAADAFIAQVEAIGDVKAEGAGDKIAAAETAYNALTESAKAMAADAKATLDAKRAEYDAYVTDKTAADAFIAQVEAIGDVKAEDAGDKIAAAESAYAALSDEAKTMAADAKATLDAKRAEYDAYLEVRAEVDPFVAQIAAIDVHAADVSDKITAAETAYENLSAEAKELVVTEKGTLDAKKAAVAFIALVNGLGDVTAEGISDRITEAQTAYETLTDEAKTLVTADKSTLDAKDAAVAFIAQVGAIGDVKAEGAGDKIKAAEDAYAALTAEMQTAVQTAKTALDAKRAEYDTYVADKSAADAFIAQVTAIGDVKAAGAGEKIAAAESAYNALTEAAKAMAADAKAALDAKRTEYDTYVADKAAANDFAKQVEAIDVNAADAGRKIAAAESAYARLTEAAKEMAAAQSATLAAKKAAQAFVAQVNAIDVEAADASGKLAAAESAYTALSDAAKAFAEQARAALDGKQHIYAVAVATASLNEKIAAITAAGSDHEAVIVAANAALEVYEGLDEAVKADEAIAGCKTTIDNALAAAKSAIERVVAELTGRIEAAVKTFDDEMTIENYNALKALQTECAALGAYGTQQLGAVGEELTAKINGVAQTPVQDRTQTSVSYALSGVTIKLYCFYTFYNIFDEVIVFDETPVVATACDAVEATGVTASAATEKDGVYSFSLTLTNFALLQNASYTFVGNTVSLNFGETIAANPYFAGGDPATDGFAVYTVTVNNQEGFAISLNGTAAKTVYLAAYNADSITKGEDGMLVFAESPLAVFDLTELGITESVTMTEFYRMLLTEAEDVFLDKAVDVRFVIYGETVENGKTSLTMLDAGTVTTAIHLELTEADMDYTLPGDILETTVDTDGVFNLFTPGRVVELYNMLNGVLGANTITEDNAAQYLCVKIEVLSQGNEVLFTDEAPLTFRGYSLSELVAAWSLAYFTEYGSVQAPVYENVSIRISFAWTENATTAMRENFPTSVSVEAALADEQKTITLDKSSLTLPDDAAIRLNAGGTAYEFVRSETGNYGALFTDGEVAYADFKLVRGDGEEIHAYLFDVDGTATFYTDLDKAGTAFTVDLITNAWCNTGDFVNFLEQNYTVGDYPFRWEDGWTISTKYVLAGTAQTYMFETDYVVTGIQSTLVMEDISNGLQIGFDAGGNVTFARVPSGGAIFADGAISHVEIHMTKAGANETVLYLYREGDVLALYKSKEKTERMDAGIWTYNDAWCTGDQFKEFVGIDDLTGYTFYTVAYAKDGVYFYNQKSMESAQQVEWQSTTPTNRTAAGSEE